MILPTIERLIDDKVECATALLVRRVAATSA